MIAVQLLNAGEMTEVVWQLISINTRAWKFSSDTLFL